MWRKNERYVAHVVDKKAQTIPHVSSPPLAEEIENNIGAFLHISRRQLHFLTMTMRRSFSNTTECTTSPKTPHAFRNGEMGDGDGDGEMGVGHQGRHLKLPHGCIKYIIQAGTFCVKIKSYPERSILPDDLHFINVVLQTQCAGWCGKYVRFSCMQRRRCPRHKKTHILNILHGKGTTRTGHGVRTR